MAFDEWFDSEHFNINTRWYLKLSWDIAIEYAAQLVTNRLSAYPLSVFPQPPYGQHGNTVDSCSAAAIRATLPGLAADIRNLKDD